MTARLAVRELYIKSLPRLRVFKERVESGTFASTLRVISALAGGNLAAALVAMLGSLVQARFVNPDDLGYLRSFSIITGYAVFLSLGSFESLHRLYPYYIGKGQRDLAIAQAEIGQSWNAAISILLAGAFVGLAVWALTAGDGRAALAWLVQAVAITAVFYGGYLGATYRTGHDFNTIAKGSLLSAAASLLTLPLFALWPYLAMIIRNSFGSLVNLVYLHIHRPLHVPWRFNWSEWAGLVRQGLPIFFASYGATSLWAVLEATLVFRFAGTLALGLWTMSFMLFQAAKMLPDAINTVYFPRINETFGRTESTAELWRLVRKPMLVGLAGMALITLCGWALLPVAAPVLLPKYAAALPVMCIMLLALPITTLELPYAFLVAQGRILQQNLIIYGSLACFLLLALAAIGLGQGLIGVVAASVLGQFLEVAFIHGYLYLTRRADGGAAASPTLALGNDLK
jgi:O-antigen/teichoic acid export membrane protein